jgi:hypothetical protein
MCRRLIPSVLLALACVATFAVAAPVASALTRDAQMKQNVRLLRIYIERAAAGNGFAYPAAAVVKKGGGLGAPVWPADPWSGKPMAPGSGRGAYTYALGAGGSAYTLVGHLSSGSFTLTGGAPAWLMDERTAAAADLSDAQAAAAAARADATAAENERDAAQAALAATNAELADTQSELADTLGQLDLAKADLATAQADRDAALADLATTRDQLAYAQEQLSATQDELADVNDELIDAKDELASTKADLETAQTDLAGMRDQTADLGARVIKGYIEQWGMLYNATAPTAAQMTKTGSVGALFSFWPDNPYTGGAMKQGTAAGDLNYAPDANGTAYSLTVRHPYAAPMDLGGVVPQQLRTALDNLRTEATNENIRVIQAAIDRYAMDYNDYFPTSEQVSWAYLSSYVDRWPKNPWTNVLMVNGPGQGDYTYVQASGGAGYTLTAHVKGGVAGDTVDDSYADHVMGLRDHLKNVYCQAAVQTLREYVEEWKATHEGTPPTVDQLTKTGEAGSSHAWWPTNPWTTGPMANGDTKGNFQYAPGEGAYTLTVRQQPDLYYLQYYTPQ